MSVALGSYDSTSNFREFTELLKLIKDLVTSLRESLDQENLQTEDTEPLEVSLEECWRSCRMLLLAHTYSEFSKHQPPFHFVLL